MAKFIKLTNLAGQPLMVRPEDITTISGTVKGPTCVDYRNKAAYVLETPDEILALIKEAG